MCQAGAAKAHIASQRQKEENENNNAGTQLVSECTDLSETTFTGTAPDNSMQLWLSDPEKRLKGGTRR